MCKTSHQDSKSNTTERVTPQQIIQALEHILPRVQRPARYVGGELNQVEKDWSAATVRSVLAFPDIYDLGMANGGIAVLYDAINKHPQMLAERTFVPWTDMEAHLRDAKLPLFSLETKHPLSAFDVVGISLPYETIYTNVLTLLDLGGIPLLAADRTESDPIVIAGGHATFNPEPMAAFIDAFVIGEGEEVLVEVLEVVSHCKAAGNNRAHVYRALADIPGVYVPALFAPEYDDKGRLNATRPLHADIPPVVKKRIVAQLPAPVVAPLVPNVQTVHNRVAVEIMRGCTRGCRFCHAGMVMRPVRERSVEEVVETIGQALTNTGYTEVGLLSLSSSDYEHVVELVKAVKDRFRHKRVAVSLPSLRIESVSVQLMEALQTGNRRGGFTLAPEAASERMRNIINKPVSTQQVIETATAIYEHGWSLIKMYFMIGHPAEQMEDVQAIADLCRQVFAVGRRICGGRARLNVGVSTFVPKPHTPFQWSACNDVQQIRAKQSLLLSQLKRTGIKLSWTRPEDTLLEALLSRGDRRISDVIHAAWKNGARFDAWQDQMRFDAWTEAFNAQGIDLGDYATRQHDLDDTLPWDHIDCGVNRSFLRKDFEWSTQQKTRRDCREACYACGILPKYADLQRNTPTANWKCPHTVVEK